jgi:uncharacterized membrane protein YraQ (UPF0718 family)
VDIVFWSFGLRFGQAALDATLTLVIGVVTAGILRRMVTPAGTRRLFGTGWKGLIRGWLAGMLLPVCSLGVIPVARELRRSGVPGGTVLAFVLAAPLLNPISFLYGLTLAEPTVILSFAVLSLLMTTTAGLLWDKVFARSTDAGDSAARAAAADAKPTPAQGIRRILAVFATAARELSGRDLLYYSIGLAGTAALSAAIPTGALQHTMHYADPWSPLLMTGLAVPIFSSPLSGMMKIGLMFDHGNSIGAAFVLFSLGLGVCLGTLAWLLVEYGPRRVLPWFVSYVAVVVVAGYAADRLLYDKRKAELDHTHAFDEYSRPYTTGTIELPQLTLKKLGEKFGPLERPAFYGFLGLLAMGLVLRRVDRAGRIERWLTRAPSTTAGRWDIRVPGPILGGVAILGLVAFSVVGAYVYYPDRDQCMDQMFAIYADASVAVKTGKTEEAIRHLELWEEIVRKLEVGTYLRKFGVTAEQSKTAEALREALEEVRDELLDQNLEGAQSRFKSEVEPAYRACKAAYPQ